jgi:hypothetical protein
LTAPFLGSGRFIRHPAGTINFVKHFYAAMIS